MWDKADTTQILLKLIDACTQCRQIFDVSTSWANPVGSSVIENIQQRLDRFSIELRNEIRRLGEHEDLLLFPLESLREYSGKAALSQVLDYYEQALSSRPTPHTRAMLNRQYSDLRQRYHELDSAAA